MLLSLNQLFSQDPLVALELLAIAATFAYLTFLSLGSKAPEPREEPRKYKNVSALEDRFWSLFEVGMAISTPKRSLRSQKILLQRA